jgi:very-short-patch-repair endonuclease
MLGGSRLAGLKFRRQAVIDGYIADFLCPALALVIEVDGASHVDPERDALRDARLNQFGYTVVRFANWQVLEQGEMVGLAIMEAAGRLQARWENGPRNRRHEALKPNAPTPGPSPEGEG